MTPLRAVRSHRAYSNDRGQRFQLKADSVPIDGGQRSDDRGPGCRLQLLQPGPRAFHRLGAMGALSRAQGKQSLPDFFEAIWWNTKDQSSSPYLDHEKSLTTIVLADIDGAQRQWNCRARRRIDFRRVPALGLAT